MTPSEFKLATEILWNDEVSHKITTNLEISQILEESLKSVGVEVVKIAKKPKSRNSFFRSDWIQFTIKTKKVVGLEISFITSEDAQAWQKAKSRSINTLSKAPDSAFENPELEEVKTVLWWNQAFSMAYRLGANLEKVKTFIMEYRGAIAGQKYNI